MRPSVIAKRRGRSDRTIWFVSHMDTVSPGDTKAWTYPPFDGTVVDDKLYGRGSEDNGQAVISTLFALKALLAVEEEPEFTIGAAVVADEEAGSDYGIKFLIEKGLFGKDDIFYVPDSGAPTARSSRWPRSRSSGSSSWFAASRCTRRCRPRD